MEKFFRSFINVYCNFIQEILLQERKEFETDAHSRLPKLKYQYNVVWMDSLCYLTCHTPWCMNHQWKCRATHCLWTQRSCSDGPVLWQEISTCHANTSTSLMYWGDTLTCRLCRILILGKLSKIKTTKHMEFSICWLKKIKVSKNAQNGFLCI